MSSVLVQDFYRPWAERRGPRAEAHYVRAGRVGMVILALALLAMSFLCFYWQRYTEAPLLDFALGVMSFAYSGLLGVYFTLLFTRRGSAASVIAALATGFLAIAAAAALCRRHCWACPASWKALAFPYQLCLGTVVAFATCVIGKQKRRRRLARGAGRSRRPDLAPPPPRRPRSAGRGRDGRAGPAPPRPPGKRR